MAADGNGDRAGTASAVRRYYEGNTRLFLALGIGGKALAMRRAVWADGVTDLPEAVNHVNTRIAEEVLACQAAPGQTAPLRVLDIGCGVGGSLFYLRGAVGPALEGVGVTISPRQVEMARRQARFRGVDGVSFLAADFSTLSVLPPFLCAFAIESFVHFGSPGSFFSAAARALEPAGRLVVVDDFLARERLAAREEKLVRAFRRGWVLSSLCTAGRAAHAAAESGLRLVEDRDLSPFLSSLPLGAPLTAFLSLVVGALPVPWSYWRSTAGSLALAACQKAGLVQYHYLVFEKASR